MWTSNTFSMSGFEKHISWTSSSRDIQGHPARTSSWDIQGHPAHGTSSGTSRNFSWNSKSTENLDFWIFNVRRTFDTSLAVDWTPKLPTQHRFCPNLPQSFQRRKLELHDITSPQLRPLAVPGAQIVTVCVCQEEEKCVQEQY